MRQRVLLTLFLCGLSQPGAAQPALVDAMMMVTPSGDTSVTVVWAYSTPTIAGFDVYLSTVLQTGPDAPPTTTVLVPDGSARTITIPNLTPGQRYYLTMDAYDAANAHSVGSTPLSIVVGGGADPRCVFPTGDQAVAIFPTALQKTGSGGAGSRARLDFQLASPNSPITSVTVLGATTTLALMTGTDLTALAGMWFVVPATPGTYALSITAANAYGCTHTQGTGYTLVVVPQ